MPEVIAMSLNGNNVLSPQLEQSINEMFTPNVNGDVSFNMNNFADLISGSLTGNTSQNGPINSRDLNRNLQIIRGTHYTLLVVICVLLLIYIYHSRHMFSSFFTNGFLKTIIKYPIFSIIAFLVNICGSLFAIHRNALKTFQKLPKYLCSNCKDKKPVKTEKTNKTVWNDIGEICNSNLESVFKDIIDNFQNDDLNEAFDNPLSSHIISDSKKTEEVISKFKEVNQLDLNNWRENLDKIKLLFTTKYKALKNLEVKLLGIKDKIKQLKDWRKTTEKLFEKLEKDQEVKNSVEDYVKKKINETDFPKLIKDYQKTYLELKTIIKFLHKNPETETISKCPICVTNVKDSFIVPCGHCACKSCLDEQFKIDKKIVCPICRASGTKVGKLFY